MSAPGSGDRHLSGMVVTSEGWRELVELGGGLEGGKKAAP